MQLDYITRMEITQDEYVELLMDERTADNEGKL
jgi:hypothetical protein